MVIGLGFVTRTVFLAQLGVALLGVNALLTSMLALLSFADLGINGALMYALYKPLRDGDNDGTASIVRYAGRLFRWVALMVAIFGVAATPFVHRLVQLDESIPQLKIYYLVLLTNVIVGYLMLNRLVLLSADQKVWLTKAYLLAFNVLRSISQVASLLLLRSFLAFLIIQVVFTLANNMLVYLHAGRLYPYVKSSRSSISVSERKRILSSVRAMMIYRLGGLILNNSPGLLISVIVGTAALGFYSNYMLIVGSAVMITEVAFASVTASVGNLVAAGDREAGRRVYDELVLLAVLVHGVIGVGVVTLVDDFMVLWLGPDFVLSPAVVVGLALNFYVVGTLMPMWSFRSATGLFRQTRLVILVTAAASIVLSLALGAGFGLAGVVFAPVLARFLTVAWYEPWILVRRHLTGRVFPYFALQIGALALWSVFALITIAVGGAIPGGALASMTAKAVILAVLLPVVTWFTFRRLDAFHALAGRVRLLGRPRGLV